MLSMAKSYMTLEEKLSTHFENLVSSHTNSIHPIQKESHRKKDIFDRSLQGQYNKYTSLTVSREKIYQNYINTEFKKGGI